MPAAKTSIAKWQAQAITHWRIKTARQLYDIGHIGAAVLMLKRALDKYSKTLCTLKIDGINRLTNPGEKS
jgi:hypothetical protein